MIKQIEINYPEFWLELTEKVSRWINVIQWPNGYWKTTIINTIHSMMTGKYPWSRTNPKGFAKVTTDDNLYTLTNGRWIWTYPMDPMITYSFPGKFFEIKTTTEQRKILIDLLDIDHEQFMLKEIWDLPKTFELLAKHTEKELRAMLKDTEAKEEIVLEDIMKYKTFIKEFKEENYDDVINYLKNKDTLIEKIWEYNSTWSTKLDKLKQDKWQLDLDIHKLLTDRDYLRLEYTKAKDSTTCVTCWHKIAEPPRELLDKLIEDWKTIWKSITTKTLSRDVFIDNINNTPEFKRLGTDWSELWESAKTLWFDNFTDVTASRLEHWEEYKHQMSKVSIYRDDLKEKNKQLKDFNTEIIKDCLLELDKIKVKFTEHLNEKVKDLPIDIELFKTQKNWEVKETFDILEDWVSYNNLSTGKRMIVQIKLAEIFANKYNTWLICIDEWSVISKDNLNYVKELAKRYQIIIVKATPWTKADMK